MLLEAIMRKDEKEIGNSLDEFLAMSETRRERILYNAAEFGAFDIIAVAYEMNVIKDTWVDGLIMTSALYGHFNIVDFLLSMFDSFSPQCIYRVLSYSVKYGDKYIFDKILELNDGRYINDRDVILPYFAILNDRVDMLEILLKHGVCVKAISEDILQTLIKEKASDDMRVLLQRYLN